MEKATFDASFVLTRQELYQITLVEGVEEAELAGHFGKPQEENGSLKTRPVENKEAAKANNKIAMCSSFNVKLQSKQAAR